LFPKGTIVVQGLAYFDFDLMLQRVNGKKVFVTRIKTNTVFETIRELKLPKDILKDEVIKLTSPQAIKKANNNIEFRLVYVFKEDENKVIKIITNELDCKNNFRPI
jgi:hypothetical protein